MSIQETEFSCILFILHWIVNFIRLYQVDFLDHMTQMKKQNAKKIENKKTKPDKTQTCIPLNCFHIVAIWCRFAPLHFFLNFYFFWIHVI